MNPSSPSVLVTGATGFTGGHLAVALQSRGYQVRALVRCPARAGELAARGIAVVPGDLLCGADVARAAEGCQYIYHIAALYRSAKYPDSAYRDVNVRGTQHVLDAAARHRVDRVVHCSTVGVHGSIRSVPADETSAFAPGDIYQQTKLEGEMLARKAFANGIAGTIFRPAAIYGPGDRRFLKLFKGVCRRRFRIFGSGEVLYHLTYIDDLVEGIILCGEHPTAVGNTYILAGSSYVTLNDLVRLVANAVQVRAPRRHLPLLPLKIAARAVEAVCRPLRIEPPLHRRRVDFFIKDRAFSIDKARTELGFQPRVELAEGLHRTAQWYLAQGLL